MIKIPKTPLSNRPQHLRGLRIAVECLTLLFLLIPIPALLCAAFGSLRLKVCFFFYAVAAVSSLFLLHYFIRKKNLLGLSIQDVQEKINIANDEFGRAKNNYLALEAKIERYNKLKTIIEELNKHPSLDQIAQSLCEISYSLIAKEKGTCLLYLIDRQTHCLSLFKTKKEDRGLVIKTKKGDMYDLWVTRHVSPLLVEDAKKDFRFDIEKLGGSDPRKVYSLISAPLVNENRFLGILRLDSPEAESYSQDDLRFLLTLCDFGAVAIENSELFQKTQDLAIHDGLTQVYTKGYFIERLQEECKRSIRRETPLSLLMLDIDFFKQYNDTFGHTAGDIVLKNLCIRMQESLKGMSPLIGRFGGEEFCALLPGIDKDDACVAAESLRKTLEGQGITLRRQVTRVTVSIGVANFPYDTIAPDELVFKADQALYRAKNQGRNRVQAA